jgi:hypothetical protein
VIITVGRPADEEHPELANRIVERVRNTTEQDVTVQVQMVVVQTADGPTERVVEPDPAADRSWLAGVRERRPNSRGEYVSERPVT